MASWPPTRNISRLAGADFFWATAHSLTATKKSLKDSTPRISGAVSSPPSISSTLTILVTIKTAARSSYPPHASTSISKNVPRLRTPLRLRQVEENMVELCGRAGLSCAPAAWGARAVSRRRISCQVRSWLLFSFSCLVLLLRPRRHELNRNHSNLSRKRRRFLQLLRLRRRRNQPMFRRQTRYSPRLTT